MILLVVIIEHTGQYSYIIPMLEDLINNQYKDKIDTSRLYTTGQSMDCMPSISLMCEISWLLRIWNACRWTMGCNNKAFWKN